MRQYEFFQFWGQFAAGKNITLALAHAAIESGYGSSKLAKKHYNFWGLSGKNVKTADGRHFASYSSPQNCLLSYQNLIAKKYPKAAQATSPKAYINALILGGYGGRNFANTPQARSYEKQFILVHKQMQAFQSAADAQLKTDCEAAFLGIFLLFFTLLSH